MIAISINKQLLLTATKKLIEFSKQQSQTLNQSLINLIFPPFCPICEKKLKNKEHLICENCYSHINYIESNFCRKCGAPLTKNRKTCKYCKTIKFHFSKVRALGSFSSPLSEMVHLLKYERKTDIAERLGIFMANLFLSDPELAASDMIIPVPLHRARRRERGYNQSELLAKVVSSISGKELVLGNVIRKKATRSQTKLNPEERIRNLKGAFSVVTSEKIVGKTIVVIDDVLTSGATLEEMTKSLLKSGVQRVYGLILARTLSA